jgi:hypothetical protein
MPAEDGALSATCSLLVTIRFGAGYWCGVRRGVDCNSFNSFSSLSVLPFSKSSLSFEPLLILFGDF